MRIPVLALALLLAGGSAALAATPAPSGTPGQRIDVIKAQPKALAPKKVLHAEYTVEINKLGQVARVRTVKPSHDQAFDAKTYGNVLQTFIRTADGQVILGTYRMTYDYDPRTMRVRRAEPQLLSRGGVDPNAKGAVDDMLEIARRNHDRTPPPGTGAGVTPGPVPSVTIRRMPDLPQVMKPTPSPAPH